MKTNHVSFFGAAPEKYLLFRDKRKKVACCMKIFLGQMADIIYANNIIFAMLYLQKSQDF